jgi:hypothetical protein
VKRREPSAERSSEAPQGLRAQLSRAVGGSLDAIRSVLSSNPKTVEVSKQRLSDVLWNDRTLLATHETASAPAPAPVRDEQELQDDEATAENVVEADLIEALDADLVEPEPDLLPDPVPDLTSEPEPEPEPVPDLRPDPEPEPLPEPDLRPDPDPVESPTDSAGARMHAEARRSEAMRARLEATKARLATRLAAPPEPPAPEPAPPAAAAAPRDNSDDDDGDEEPIRTRSMARLLASQGHRNRALKIYDALLAANGGDAELRAEAEALRRPG